MDPRSSKLQRQQTSDTQLQAGTQGKEFGSVEELLRQDAAGVEVPPTLAGRVADSVAREPRPARPWWRRWLPGG